MTPAPDAAAPFPVRLHRLTLAGLVILLGSFGSLAAWSVLAPLSSAVQAPGAIVVASNRKIVQHLEGGTIKTILVNDGDQVQRGQILMELDDARLASSLSTTLPLILINEAIKARLIAERRGDPEIDFGPVDKNNPLQSSIMDDQRRIFAARREARATLRATLINKHEQALVQIEGLREQIRSEERRLRLTEEELEGIDSLIKRQNAPKRRGLELNRALEEVRGKLAELRAKLAETEKQAEYYKLEIERVETSFLEEVEAQLQTKEEERYTLRERVEELQEQIGRLKIVAPVSGVVVNRAVHTVGGVIAPGAPLLEIVPGGDPLQVEARVRPMDVEGLAVGMPVEVRFPGLKEKLLPRLQGSLAHLSADLVTDRNNGAGYFVARIDLDDKARDLVGSNNIRPGVPVEVMLLKQSRTVLEYFFGTLYQFFVHAMRE